MLLFCAKTIVKESRKFELARLKKKKKKILAVWQHDGQISGPSCSGRLMQLLKYWASMSLGVGCGCPENAWQPATRIHRKVKGPRKHREWHTWTLPVII